MPAGRASSAARSRRAVAAEHDASSSAPSAAAASRGTDVARPAQRQVASASPPAPARSARPPAEPARSPAGRCSTRRRPPGVRRRQDRCVARRHSGGPSVACRPARSAAARSATARRRRPLPCSQRKYSTLPAGPGSGLAVTPRTPRPSVVRGLGHVAHRLAPAAPGRGPPRRRRPAPCPTSNCGLTIIDAVGRRRRRTAASAGSTRRSEMNDRSPTISVGRLADHARGSGRGR